MQPHSKSDGMSSEQGFTLIELALVVLILAILAAVALPTYREFTDKAKLADLELRVDAMRTAMATAYETGDRSMLGLGAGKPGEIPAALANVPLRDAMIYPGLQMLLMSSDQPFGQFAGGAERPYLVLGIDAGIPDAARTLRHFSDVYPDSGQAWWVPSSVMVIPLLDDNVLGIKAVAPGPGTDGPSGPGTGSGPGPGTGNGPGPGTDNGPGPDTSTGTGPAATGTGNGPDNTAAVTNPVTTTGTSPTPAVVTIPKPPTVTQPIVQATTPTCIHPGKGHAWGRCRNQNN